jgi:hypothetical protein
MKKFPPSDLTPIEKQALLALTYHDGWKVLVRLMERRVKNATVRMLDIKPDDPNRAQLMDKLQSDAFAKNDFCDELMQEVNWHVQTASGDDEDEASPAEEKIIDAAVKAGYIKQA